MKVVDLLEDFGIVAKRVGSTHGGEYHSPCPGCGGNDRFCVWPKQGDSGRYWCRQCQNKGDAIQFCRDFLGLSYKEACSKLGAEVKTNTKRTLYQPPGFQPKSSECPSIYWLERATAFVQQSHQVLLKNPEGLRLLHSRGLSVETAENYRVGYRLTDIWEARSNWGLNEELHEDGLQKKLWLPAGLVVPTLALNKSILCKIKIRRSHWKEGDTFPKYVEIAGSQKQYAIYGDRSLPFIVVEAEIDGILLQQEAGDVCCTIALGGASKRPDVELHDLLRSAPGILFSLDFDEAGKNAYAFWKRTYPQVKAWPAPVGKSPSEAFQKGVCLKEWVLSGIKQMKIR